MLRQSRKGHFTYGFILIEIATGNPEPCYNPALHHYRKTTGNR